MTSTPSTGAPTSLLSLQSGAPVGLGLMLQSSIADQPKILFCPSSDQSQNADAELAKVGISQAQSGYYYRHAGITAMNDLSVNVAAPAHIKLDNLGDNRNGLPIRALAVDTIFLSPPSLSVFGVNYFTQHHQQGRGLIHRLRRPRRSQLNGDGRFTVSLVTISDLTAAFSKILGVLEQADTEP